MNHLWAITIGDYEFVLDRRALTYRLTETKTNTVWADGLSVGWIELEERETGKITRRDFGACRVLSLSEKAGPQGKRILLGLDLLGVPIDVYFTCTAREIQLTVEASRDTKTHEVKEIGLLPGLCSVPCDALSYLALPQDEGKLIFAREVNDGLRNVFTVWNSLKMPFLGAVRSVGSTGETSALALLTDSAYASACLHAAPDANVTADWEYMRDPERRRLDLRVVPLPQGDHVTIAQAYREKIIGERNHITLRKKIRERPLLDKLIGAARIRLSFPTITGFTKTFTQGGEQVKELKERFGIENAVCFLVNAVEINPDGTPGNINEAAGGKHELREMCERIRAAGYFVGFNSQVLKSPSLLPYSLERLREICELTGAQVLQDYTLAFTPLFDEPAHRKTRWDDIDARLQLIEEIRAFCPLIGTKQGNDWASLALDFTLPGVHASETGSDLLPTVATPLSSAVYHDSLISYNGGLSFWHSLLSLSPPEFHPSPFLPQEHRHKGIERFARDYAVLAPLYRLTFPAFLTEHRFLTPGLLVQEAVYSDKTRVVINGSRTEPYKCDDLSLPPMGFYVRHMQMEAHDAIRVGDKTFATRAWRVMRSRDGLPLETSADVLHQELPV